MAGKTLFLPAGWAAPVGGAAVHGIESGAGEACGRAESWRWSSAAVHCRAMAADGWLDMEAWEARWDAATWRDYLRAGQTELDIMAVRHCTHTGRPLGSDEFVRELEERTKRALAPQKGGRAAATEKNKGQEEFAFEP